MGMISVLNKKIEIDTDYEAWTNEMKNSHLFLWQFTATQLSHTAV